MCVQDMVCKNLLNKNLVSASQTAEESVLKHSAIELKNFSFSYDGQRKILDNLSLEIKQGERILILGPSGCGKSSLTLCLNGIIPQLIDGKIEGVLKLEDMDIMHTPISILSQHIGIVFQDPESQFCMLKVEDEVAFGLENLMFEREIIKEKITDSLRKVNLLPYQNWQLNRLSGGMNQRIAIASLLALDQEILVFDEPTSNLDPTGTREVSNVIRKLPKSKTLLIIEHKLDKFMDIFDKILLLDGMGRQIAFDEVENILLKFQSQMQQMGVWIPHIPKFFYKLRENNINFKDFPLNKEDAKKIIDRNHKDRQKIIEILKKEASKEICEMSDASNNFTTDSSIEYPIIKVENLYYKFRQSEDFVLENINFSLNKGDFLGIVGHNGSGKTTLAKLLINLYKARPPSKIEIYNPSRQERKAAAKNEILDFTGFVFQNPEHQFVEDTVYEEITYGLKIKYSDEDLINIKAEKILKIMDLKNFKETNPFSLSQGQKRKLSVASILVMGSEIIILDEPTFGLDYITTINLMNILTELNREGKTIIIITHDMNVIFKYTNKVLALKNGRCVFFGGTLKLLNNKEIIKSCSLAIPSLCELYKEVGDFAIL